VQRRRAKRRHNRAACTHAPLMAAVLVFELSGDYAIVLPLVLSTALATTVSRRLHCQIHLQRGARATWHFLGADVRGPARVR
jgi:H+/Cl- antiporter ClcA